MPQYTYTARDLAGKRHNGTLDASTEREATDQLAAKSLFPIDVSLAKDKSLANIRPGGKKVGGQILAIFYTQLASLLQAGVPMIRALNVLSDQSANDTLKETLKEIRGKVEDGEPLGDAMGRHPKIFSDMACNMVRAGSEGGFLEDALNRVGDFTELQEDLKGRTVSAMAYPVFLFSVGSVVLSALLVFFVPNFDMMFERLRAKGEMPWITEALLSFSKGLQSYGWIIPIVLLVVFIVLRSYLRSDAGKRMADIVKLKIPVLGDILMNLAVARFCRVLGTLLANGVPILKSLDIAATAAGNRLLSSSVLDASENIRSGDALAKPLRKSGYFPPSVIEMISVGEESNSLDTVLPDIANSLEKQTFRRLDLFVRLLEPLMLLVMAVLVLGIVLSLLVPVLKSSTTL
ncbi:MAG: type II secretion system F family protein [Planctomycetota bacterium]